MNIDAFTSDTKITFHIHLLKVVFLAVKFRLSDVEMWTHERDIVLKTNMCPADALNKHGGYNGTFCAKVGCFLPLINSSVIIITTEQIVPKQDIQIIYLSFVHISRYHLINVAYAWTPIQWSLMEFQWSEPALWRVHVQHPRRVTTPTKLHCQHGHSGHFQAAVEQWFPLASSQTCPHAHHLCPSLLWLICTRSQN